MIVWRAARPLPALYDIHNICSALYGRHTGHTQGSHPIITHPDTVIVSRDLTRGGLKLSTRSRGQVGHDGTRGRPVGWCGDGGTLL